MWLYAANLGARVLIRVGASSASLTAAPTDTDTLVTGPVVSRGIGIELIAARIHSSSLGKFQWGHSVRLMANSSPPIRPTMSSARTVLVNAASTARNTASPVGSP